jgi:threonine dehydrogenase-like Zn-dependent dehydrogenase
VPDGLPDEVAVFTEPTAAALELQEQVRVCSGDRVVVIGPGKLGNLVSQTLAATGCQLLVVGRSERPLGLLSARGIATATAEGIEPRRADLAVECTGSPEGLELARRAVRPRGTIVLKSTYHGKAAIDMAPFVVDEITLVGSRCGPFAPALLALARGEADPRPLVEARYPLAEAVAAFDHASRPGALKILVDCRSAATAPPTGDG